ncbi:MAG: ABC transporter permease subunit [Polyangiaceae bacterium]
MISRRAVARLAPLALLVVVAALARATGSATRLDPSRAWATPTAAHPLGFGEAGVDLLPFVATAVLRGVGLAAFVAAVAFAFGTVAGAAAALRRGVAERVVERACDLLQAFPGFLLAMVVLSAVRAPSRMHLAFVFLLTAWAPFARLALAETRVLREAAFVSAAVALGAEPREIVVRHVLPNLLGVGVVQLGATGAAIVVGEAALAFVGLGPSDGVSLGALLDQGVAAMLRAPHVLALGAASVFVTSVALLAVGKVGGARERA